MQMCDSGKQIDPGIEGDGVTQESGGVKAQLCNFQSNEITCKGDDIKILFQMIPCGSQGSPTKGR
jgi:hypothetical protein